MRKRIEYTFGDLIGGHKYVKEADDKVINGRKYRQVVVKCQFCGREFIARHDHLRSGLVYSCGCTYRYREKRKDRVVNSENGDV